jgi:hypothetical protein
MFCIDWEKYEMNEPRGVKMRRKVGREVEE